MADVRAMVRELADWDRQGFPLGGGDMIVLMVRFGFVTAEEAEQTYREFMREHDEDDEWPPASNAYVTPDDAIPF